MTPEAAVARLVEFVTAHFEFDQGDAFKAMKEAGVPGEMAALAFQFTLMAWGRESLREQKIAFPPDYLCFNAAGDVVECGELGEQPYYVAARRLARMNARSRGFARLASMSSDVQAVNKALKDGTQAQDIITVPPAIFVEPPTTEGMAKAKKVLALRMQAAREARPKPKPAPPPVQETPMQMAKRLLAAKTKVPQVGEALLSAGVAPAEASRVIDQLMQVQASQVSTPIDENEAAFSWFRVIAGAVITAIAFAALYFFLIHNPEFAMPQNSGPRMAIRGGILGGGGGLAAFGLNMMRKELMVFIGQA